LDLNLVCLAPPRSDQNGRAAMTDMPRQEFNSFVPPERRATPAASAPSASAHPAPSAAERVASPSAIAGASVSSFENATQPIGIVIEIAGSGSQIALDVQRLNECMTDQDPSIALAGQVGSQIKVKTS